MDCNKGFRWQTRALSLLLLTGLGGFGVKVQAVGPEPAGWYAGDMHVHRNCGTTHATNTVAQVFTMMTNADLSVVSLLADMGNGEVAVSTTDLPLVNGKDASISTTGRILHWDTEWHWDADYTQYPHQALGGHIVALGLTNAYQIWNEMTYPIFEWAHQQGGIAGFAHFQYLSEFQDDSFPTAVTCCTPIEYPVEVALGACDFISEDALNIAGQDYCLRAYYRLLNCGFRPGFAAGSDYPCGPAVGPILTYAQVAGGQLTYSNWVHAIAAGRTMLSLNGRNEFVSLVVNGTATPGDEIALSSGGSVPVTIQWTANQNLTGAVELVCNGQVFAQPVSLGDGEHAGDVEHERVFFAERVVMRAADEQQRASGPHGGGVCDGERGAGARQRSRCPVLCAVGGEPADEHLAGRGVELVLSDGTGGGAVALPVGAEHLSANRYRGRRSAPRVLFPLATPTRGALPMAFGGAAPPGSTQASFQASPTQRYPRFTPRWAQSRAITNARSMRTPGATRARFWGARQWSPMRATAGRRSP